MNFYFKVVAVIATSDTNGYNAFITSRPDEKLYGPGVHILLKSCCTCLILVRHELNIWIT